MNARTVQLVRGVSVIAGTAALIFGVTLAVTTTNAVDAAGTVSVSENLLISDTAGTGYAATETGFLFPTHPGSPTVAHTHMFLQTTEPVNTVVLSARIAQWDANLAAAASHLTLNFKLGANTTSVPFTTLGSADSSLAALGPLTALTDNDLEAWVTADPSTPNLSSLNGFHLSLTGTSDGNVTP